jgi:CRP/FNR family transcriptional regulator, cyclic AMP receptor protein
MKHLSLIEKAFFLKNTDLFEELDLELLLAIADKLSQDIYDKGEKVFYVNQVANRMYFIAEGKVELKDEKQQVTTKLGSNKYFGDESLFNEKPRAYEATCLADSLILSLSRTHLLTIISECPSVALCLLRSFAKLFQCRQTLEDPL